ANLGMAAAAAGLAWYVGAGATSTVPIFAFMMVIGTGRAFAGPATRSMPADLLPPARLPWYTVRSSGTFQIAAATGPVTVGFLYDANRTLAFVVPAVLWVVAAAFLATLPDPRAAIAERSGRPLSRPGLRDAMEGLHFLRETPLVLGLISLDLFGVLFGGAVFLLPAIAKEQLGVGAVGLGWLRAAVGIGA